MLVSHDEFLGSNGVHAYSEWIEAQEGPKGSERRAKNVLWELACGESHTGISLGFRRGPTICPCDEVMGSVPEGEREAVSCGRALMTWIKLVSSSRTTARNRVSWLPTDEKYYARNSSLNRPSCEREQLIVILTLLRDGSRDLWDCVRSSIARCQPRIR